MNRQAEKEFLQQLRLLRQQHQEKNNALWKEHFEQQDAQRRLQELEENSLWKEYSLTYKRLEKVT
jgi:hypothetical protein